MSPLPIEDWTAALDRMSAALAEMRAGLDVHLSSWGTVIDTRAESSPPDLLLAWLERRLTQWDAQLAAAAELAAEVEGQLHDREAVIVRWRDVFARWRNLIEQEMCGVPSPTGSTG